MVPRIPQALVHGVPTAGNETLEPFAKEWNNLFTVGAPAMRTNAFRPYFCPQLPQR